MGRVAFIILSNIHDGWSFSTKIVNGLRKLTIFAKKALPQMFDWIPKTPPIGVF